MSGGSTTPEGGGASGSRVPGRRFRLVLLGDPVSHSRSPAIHSAALAATGLDGRYRARRVDAEGVRRAFAELRAGDLEGANVTMPHKASAAALADTATGDVLSTGSANTLRAAGGRVEAANTDVGGLLDAARAADIPEDAPVLVLGAGGSAAAALFAFRERAPLISVRRPEGARAVTERVGVAAVSVPWGTAVTGALVVNATPLGMRGEGLPEAVIEAAGGLIDLPYGSSPTPAVSRAAEAGIPFADGLSVLVAQAARSFTWWTGLPAPLEAMRAAARDPDG